MKYVIKFSCLALVIFLPMMLQAQSKVGTTAGGFLEIGVGARGVGMGETIVASTDDVSSLYWNPSGITQLPGGQATFHHTSWIAGTSLNYAAFAFNVPNIAHIGAQIYIFDSGEMEVTDIIFPDGTGENFKVQDIMIGLTAARQLTNNFSIGGSVKYIQSTIWRMSASTIGLDLGMQYDTPLNNLRIGFNISNFGGEMLLTGDNTLKRIDLDPNSSGNNDGLLANLALRSWDIPLTFRLGMGYTVFETSMHRFLVVADALYPNSNDPYLNVGAEYGFNNLLFLRGGLSQLLLDDAEGMLRLGFGINVMDRIQADFAWSDRGLLGSTNMVGISVSF
ncbi:MAG: PorV/PorQ family protein [Balneolales bacterium]|nr:PorV/PorQ family protein [Balneolales bacterium]